MECVLIDDNAAGLADRSIRLLRLQDHLQRFPGLGDDLETFLNPGQRQGLGDGVFDVDLLLGNERQGGGQIGRGGAVG